MQHHRIFNGRHAANTRFEVYDYEVIVPEYVTRRAEEDQAVEVR